MALNGVNNEQKIWNYLYKEIQNDCGVAGLMGNLQAESGFNPKNLQNSFEKKLGMNDEEYTKAVDNGSYNNFINDKAGYGLAQWTYWSLKRDLYNYVKSNNKSIGDLETQLEFLCKQLKESYTPIWDTLKTTKDIKIASNEVLLKFERPANQGLPVQNTRAKYAQDIYNKYAAAASASSTSGGDSPLVDCTIISPNKNVPRNHAIDRITIHCVVGQLSAESIGNCFISTNRQASCNYGIGYDGRVVKCVEEKDRSWCSTSSSNDHRAITIECASDKVHPYAFNAVVYDKLINLCVDICRRHGKNKLLWIPDKDIALSYPVKNNEMLLTVHRWFAAKACPGDWMMERMSSFATQVNKILGGAAAATTSKPIPQKETKVKVLVNNLNIRTVPSMSGIVKGQTGVGVFTIVDTTDDGWGLLKSYQRNRDGWIYLENPKYVKIL